MLLEKDVAVEFLQEEQDWSGLVRIALEKDRVGKMGYLTRVDWSEFLQEEQDWSGLVRIPLGKSGVDQTSDLCRVGWLEFFQKGQDSSDENWS